MQHQATSERRRPTRWAVPALALVFSATGFGLVPRLASADTSPTLPAVTAAELLAKVSQAGVPGISGDVTTTPSLGLPELPASNGDPTITDFLSTAQSFHVWSNAAGSTKVQLPAYSSETDVIRNGQDLWLWQSTGHKVTHVILPAPDPAHQQTGTAADAAMAMTPQQLAARLIGNVTSTTDVSVGVNVSVANRSAYELVITPKSTTSLVGQIRIAVDSATSVPLRVQLLARNASKPAFSAAYTSVDFTTPAASTFVFTPPRSAVVTTKDLTKDAEQAQAEAATGAAQPDTSALDGLRPTVVGSGWDTSVILPALPKAFTNSAPKASANSAKDGGDEAASVQDLLAKSSTPVSGAFGSGKLLHTALVNVVLLDDGRVAIGSTDQATLLASIPAA